MASGQLLVTGIKWKVRETVKVEEAKIINYKIQVTNKPQIIKEAAS